MLTKKPPGLRGSGMAPGAVREEEGAGGGLVLVLVVAVVNCHAGESVAVGVLG